MGYNGFMQVEVLPDSQAADAYTMRDMTVESYAAYLKEDLFLVDHRGVLRVVHGDYPVATSSEQIALLITFLQDVLVHREAKLGECVFDRRAPRLNEFAPQVSAREPCRAPETATPSTDSQPLMSGAACATPRYSV